MTRFRHTRAARVTFVAIALAWLQMALVPCVMASVAAGGAEAGDPVQSVGQILANQDAGASAASPMQHDCPYCPPGADACDDQASPPHEAPGNCVFPHGAQSDSAAGQHYGWSVLTLAIAPDSWLASKLPHDRPTLVSAYSAPPAPRPLRLRHCVQLK